DHHHPPGLANRLARLVEPVELPALVKQRGLRGVQVLGLALVEHASAEADNTPPIVVDRKHDAVAEAVVAAVGLPAHGEPGLDQRLARPGADAQGARQVVPAVGRITETEGGGHLAADSPSLEIRHGTLASAQLLPVKP